MNNKLMQFLLICFLFNSIFIQSIEVNAADLAKINQHHACEVLKCCKLVDENIEEYTETYVTRRQALYLTTIILNNYIVYFDEKEQKDKLDSWNISFSDIEINTPDCLLVISSYHFGLLKGKKTEESQRIAALDDYLTYQEAAYLFLRLTDFRQHEYYLDETWIDFYNSLQSELIITKQQMTEYIEMKNFLYMVYETINRPFQTIRYGGELTERIIEKYIGEVTESSLGRFPDYKKIKGIESFKEQ